MDDVIVFVSYLPEAEPFDLVMVDNVRRTDILDGDGFAVDELVSFDLLVELRNKRLLKEHMADVAARLDAIDAERNKTVNLDATVI